MQANEVVFRRTSCNSSKYPTKFAATVADESAKSSGSVKIYDSATDITTTEATSTRSSLIAAESSAMNGRLV
jgi:hypothetical protein